MTFPSFHFRGTVYRRVAASMTLFAVCVIVLIGGVSYAWVNRLFKENLRISMEANARMHAVKLSSALDAVQENLSSLSSNTLLINAILDTSGNRLYIEAFINSYKPAGHTSIDLTLCDFQGRAIASNRPATATARHDSPNLLKQVVGNSLPYSEVLPPPSTGEEEGARLLLAYPVIWGMTKQAEGILVADIPVGDMVNDQFSSAGTNGTGYRISSWGRVLFSKEFHDNHDFQFFDMPLPTATPMKELGLAIQIESHQKIFVWWLIPAFAASGALLFILSTLLARLISRSVTSHLRELQSVAQRVAESGTLDAHAEVAGPDDVQALATSFNAMIDRVKSSQDDLERRVEERTVELSQTVAELQDALGSISTLRGLLPICASCKKIRDDNGYWNQIETYLKKHTEADFSHGICPDCAEKLYGEFLKK